MATNDDDGTDDADDDTVTVIRILTPNLSFFFWRFQRS